MKPNKIHKRPCFIKPEILLQELPKPLHTITPRFILGGKEWRKLKNIAAAQNNFCCWGCGVNINETQTFKRLEGAPVFVVEEKYKIVYHRDVAALCYKCNSFLNISKVKSMEAQGLYEKGFSEEIVLHGSALVNVLEKIENINVMNSQNDFANWCYNFNGVEYFSRFNDVCEYNTFFKPKGN